MGENPILTIYFDGSCEPVNPGGTAAWGYVVYENGTEVHSDYGIIGSGPGMTNNVAEYKGLIESLKWVNDNYPSNQLEIKGDSKLVIFMVAKKWGWLGKKKKIYLPHKKFPHLKALLDESLELLKYKKYSLSWVPREMNSRADELSKMATAGMDMEIKVMNSWS